MERMFVLLKYLLTLLMFVVIILEETFWSLFEAVSGFFARFKLIRKLEDFVAARKPGTCLALFLIPITLMLPFKFAGVWLIARGHTLDGLFMFVSAKATGTFLAARLFALTRSKLLGIRWFAYCYKKFIAWKDGVKNYIHATASYQAYRKMRDALDARLAEIFKRER